MSEVQQRLPEQRGRGIRRRNPHAVRAVALAAAWAALGAAGPLQAQETPTPAAATAPALHAVSIAPGPLNEVLVRYAAEVGVQLTVSPEALAGLRSGGLQGRVSVDAGFRQLLADSGFEAVDQGGQAYVLRRLPGFPEAAPASVPAAAVGPGAGEAADTRLPAVRVTGQTLQDGLTEGSRSYATRSTSAATGLTLTPRETPQSVSVITRERMDDQALTSLGAVIEQVTGLTTYGRGGASAASYSGVNSRGYAISNVLLDGLLVPMSLFSGGAHEDWSSVDSSAFDSVTVVRGANGLITGSGEPSGTIALTRKRPTDSFQGTASLSLGRWNARRATVDVGGPLTQAGTLRGRLVAVHGESDSWVARYSSHETSFYGIVEADLAARTRLWAALEHGRTSGLGAGPYPGFNTVYVDDSPTPFTRGGNSYTDWSYNRVRRTHLTLGLDHAFNDDWSGRLQFLTGTRSSDRKFGNVSFTPELDGMVTIYARRLGDKDRPKAFFGSLEGRYRLWDREHQFTAGVNGYTSKSDDQPGNGDATLPPAQTLTWNGLYPEPDWSTIDLWTRSRYETEQVGLFVNNRLKVLDSLALITGARLSQWRTRTTELDTGAVTDDRKEDAVFTPFLGVVYDFSSELSAYASYTTIFSPQSSVNQSGQTLDPEEGRSFELGLKGSWYGDRLNAAIAVFETRKDNLAVLDGGVTPEGDPSYAPVDHTKGRGWELEVSGEPLPGWNVQAGYGRVVIKDSAGARLLVDVPKESFKLFTAWTPEQLKALRLGGGLQWQSKGYADWVSAAALDASTIKAFTVVNLMAGYRFNRAVDLNLNLENVFDRHYRVDTTGHDYGSPRALTATLRYQF